MDKEGVLKLPYPRLVEIWKANMNHGIWALLYGEGDFYQTLQYAMALGYDADCNAVSGSRSMVSRATAWACNRPG